MIEPWLDGEYVALQFKAWEADGYEDEPSTFLRFHAGKVVVPDDEQNGIVVGAFAATYVDYQDALIERMRHCSITSGSAHADPLAGKPWPNHHF